MARFATKLAKAVRRLLRKCRVSRRQAVAQREVNSGREKAGQDLYTEKPQQQTRNIPLPPEIVAQTVSRLPPDSETAFALTCRAFYREFIRSPVLLTSRQRRALLARIEKDVPHLYLCHRCNRLHTWHRVPDPDDPTGVPRYDGHCKRRDDRRGLARPPPHPQLSYNFDFHVARLVVNRYLYGKDHGPALVEALDRTALRQTARKNGVTIGEEWNARVMGGELYLRTVAQVYHARGCARSLREYLGGPATDGWYPICPHVSPERWRPMDGMFSLPGVGDGSAPDGAFVVPDPGHLSSCKCCYTDYRVGVVKTPGPERWVIVLAAWHRLGKCRSPDDHKWHNFVHPWDTSVSRPRVFDSGPGEVYCDWRKGDGVKVDVKRLGAQFVGHAFIG